MSEIASPLVTATAAHFGPSSAIAHNDPNTVMPKDERETKPKPRVGRALPILPRSIPRLKEAHLPEQGTRDRKLDRDDRWKYWTGTSTQGQYLRPERRSTAGRERL
jgi:hypothetical protein